MRHRSTCFLPALSLGLVSVVLTGAACRDDLPRGSSRAAPTPAPPAAPPPTLTRATPADLAHELDLADERGTWQDVRARWQGQVLRWRVRRVAALCRDAGACNVAVFSPGEGPAAGWLPSLRFAPGQFAALEDRCRRQDPCEVTIEGTLESLQVSGELPTNLELADVRVTDG